MSQKEPIKPDSPVGSRRLMSLGQFVFIAFFLTCGGPFGLEPAVQAGGIAATIGGLLLLPIIWSIPQSLMTAELSSMMSVNGGGLVWVWRGLGTCAGVANAYNSLSSALVDVCLYPDLIVQYIPLQLGKLQLYLLKVAILALVTLSNMVGLNVVGLASLLLMVVSLSVFVAEIPFAIASVSPVDLLHTPHIDWATLSAVLLWSASGWDALGNFAGEVKNPTRTYPIGIALSMLAGTMAYIVPLAVSYILLPDSTLWEGNAFLFAAERATGPNSWLVIWVVVASMLANFGQLLAGTAATSRLMWAMGACNKDEGIQMRTLPRALAYVWPRFETPLTALIVQFIITSFISFWDFETLVQFLALLNCVRLSLEFAAFIVLKYREPFAARPFAVPFGLTGAWFVTGVKVAVLILVITWITIDQPLVAAISLAVNVVIVIAASFLGGPDCSPCLGNGFVLNDDGDDLKASVPDACC